MAGVPAQPPNLKRTARLAIGIAELTAAAEGFRDDADSAATSAAASSVAAAASVIAAAEYAASATKLAASRMIWAYDIWIALMLEAWFLPYKMITKID